MPTMQPRTGFEHFDQLKVAHQIVGDLLTYRRPHAPPKPVELPPDDVLLKLLARKRAEQRLNADELESIATFVFWRDAVWAVEEMSAARLRCLYIAIQVLEEEAKGITEETKILRQHIKDEWGRWPPKEVGAVVIRDDATALSQEMVLLPRHLRGGE